MKLGDLNWTLPPLCSFLYTFGGWGVSKGIRRIGIPIAITLYAILYYRTRVKRNILMYALFFLALFGTLTLPLTAFGESMSKMNVAWSFVLGYLNIMTLYPLTQLRNYDWHDRSRAVTAWFYGAYVFAMLYGFCVLISYNWNGFEHKWTEMMAGFSIGFMAACLIGKE